MVRSGENAVPFEIVRAQIGQIKRAVDSSAHAYAQSQIEYEQTESLGLDSLESIYTKLRARQRMSDALERKRKVDEVVSMHTSLLEAFRALDMFDQIQTLHAIAQPHELATAEILLQRALTPAYPFIDKLHSDLAEVIPGLSQVPGDEETSSRVSDTHDSGGPGTSGRPLTAALDATDLGAEEAHNDTPEPSEAEFPPAPPRPTGTGLAAPPDLPIELPPSEDELFAAAPVLRGGRTEPLPGRPEDMPPPAPLVDQNEPSSAPASPHEEDLSLKTSVSPTAEVPSTTGYRVSLHSGQTEPTSETAGNEGASNPAPPENEPRPLVSIRTLSITDIGALVNEQPIPLTPREKSLLEFLLQHTGEMFKGPEIAKRVFDLPSAQEAGTRGILYSIKEKFEKAGFADPIEKTGTSISRSYGLKVLNMEDTEQQMHNALSIKISEEGRTVLVHGVEVYGRPADIIRAMIQANRPLTRVEIQETIGNISESGVKVAMSKLKSEVLEPNDLTYERGVTDTGEMTYKIIRKETLGEDDSTLSKQAENSDS